MNFIDLRSDTLTTPTDAMRKAMYEAEVGDDGRIDEFGRGGDPTVNKLEDYAAELMGKEAALFCASGTMGNIVSLVTQCERGDKIGIEANLHLIRSEKSPFMADYFGLKKVEYQCSRMGIPEVTSFEQVCASGIRLICIENSHNFGGGVCSTVPHFQALYQTAKKHDVQVHLDGARIFNAATALQVDAKQIADCADTVMFCLSKGLGAPYGSMLCGSKEFIKQARETRKYVGGGLRQGGVMAAAGLFALKNDIPRLIEDQENAKLLGKFMGAFECCDLVPVETNIVMLEISKTGKTSDWFEKQLAPLGLYVKGMGENYLRMTTYREITQSDIEQVGVIFSQFMQQHNLK